MQLFSFKSMNYLKMFLEIKSLNRKQCPARLFPIIIHSPPSTLGRFDQLELDFPYFAKRMMADDG